MKKEREGREALGRVEEAGKGGRWEGEVGREMGGEREVGGERWARNWAGGRVGEAGNKSITNDIDQA